jgi:hypothetical protein
MARANKQDAESSVNSERLASLLDKLVAVHLDLEPLCGQTTLPPGSLFSCPQDVGKCARIPLPLVFVVVVEHDMHAGRGD